MGRWFGSSGIRGPYRPDQTPALALRLGALTAGPTPRILVGHDVRTTGPLLAHAFTAGATSAGARVTWAGPAATPSLAYAARHHDVAVAITASHNPAPDNGFKFWNPDGSAWTPKQEAALETALAGTHDRPRPTWDRLSPTAHAPEVTTRHIEAIQAFAGTTPLDLVLDCGNGAGSYISPKLFGPRADVLWGDPDGRFPNRPSEPSDENLDALKERCRKSQRWGIAHDGDADRMVPVDPNGHMVPPEQVMVALALLRGARRMVTPVDASLALAQALPDVKWTFCRVGDAAVSATLLEIKGDLGAETSGTYVVPAFDYAPDGPLAAMLFLRAAHDGLVEQAKTRLRPTVRRSTKTPLGSIDRTTFLDRLARVELRAGERSTRVDGLRLDTESGWILIRPSGTEPIVRLTVEAWDAANAKALQERGDGLLHALLA